MLDIVYLSSWPPHFRTDSRLVIRQKLSTKLLSFLVILFTYPGPCWSHVDAFGYVQHQFNLDKWSTTAIVQRSHNGWPKIRLGSLAIPISLPIKSEMCFSQTKCNDNRLTKIQREAHQSKTIHGKVSHVAQYRRIAWSADSPTSAALGDRLQWHH